MFDHFFIERHQANRIVLPDSEKRERRSEVLRVLKLGHFAARITHRCAGIDEQMNLRIGVALILLDVQPICSSKQLPIEMTQVVARHVLAIGGKIHAETQVGRTVKTLHKSFNDGARGEFEVLNLHQNLRIYKAVLGLFDDGCAHRANLSVPILEPARPRSTA